MGANRALVDLQAPALVGRTHLSGNIVALALTSKGIYVAGQNPSAVYSLSIRDLSVVQRTFTPQPVMSLEAIGDCLYISLSQGQAALYHLPDFTPLDTLPPA